MTVKMMWTASCEILDDAAQLTRRLSSEQFSAPDSACFRGTIGGHMRHCIQHFEAFKKGLITGVIDYDSRERGTPGENDPEVALQSLIGLCNWLREQSVSSNSGPIQVRTFQENGDQLVDSSIGRELNFLVSHTIHHFAIISIMCKSLGVEVDPDFGVAPSTLKYQQSFPAK